MKSKILGFIGANIGSWIIEIGILSIVAVITISEVRQTNEQTREMLSAVSAFASERKEAVGGAIDSIAKEAKNVEVGGKVDIGDAAQKALDKWLKKEDE